MIDLPDDITTYSEEQLTALIKDIRQRRDKPLLAFKAAQALAQSKIEDKLKIKIDKELKMFAKVLDAVNKRIEELENRAVRITALRLEAGDISSGKDIYGEQYIHGQSPDKSA